MHDIHSTGVNILWSMTKQSWVWPLKSFGMNDFPRLGPGNILSRAHTLIQYNEVVTFFCFHRLEGWNVFIWLMGFKNSRRLLSMFIRNLWIVQARQIAGWSLLYSLSFLNSHQYMPFFETTYDSALSSQLVTKHGSAPIDGAKYFRFMPFMDLGNILESSSSSHAWCQVFFYFLFVCSVWLLGCWN